MNVLDVDMQEMTRNEIRAMLWAAANGKLLPLPLTPQYANLTEVLDVIGEIGGEVRHDQPKLDRMRKILMRLAADWKKWSSACGRSKGGNGPFWRHWAN
jgi:hypothetical protein